MGFVLYVSHPRNGLNRKKGHGCTYNRPLLSKNGFNHGVTSFDLFIQIGIAIGIGVEIAIEFYMRWFF